MTIETMGEASSRISPRASIGPGPLVKVRDVSHSFDPVDPSNKVLK
jgi:hypothetical protein